MLALNGNRFTTGRARYYDDDPDRARSQSAIYVQIILPLKPPASILALLDTGCPYCIFDKDIMQELGFTFDGGAKINLRTPRGTVSGTVDRLQLTVTADEGESLDVDATVFVSDEWNHGSFIGYGGFLDRLRFAIDPLTNSFYFGPSD